MFGSEGNNAFDQFVSFVEGDHDACPFSSWIHYIQLGFMGLIVFVSLFCGSRAGG